MWESRGHFQVSLFSLHTKSCLRRVSTHQSLEIMSSPSPFQVSPPFLSPWVLPAGYIQWWKSLFTFLKYLYYNIFYGWNERIKENTLKMATICAFPILINSDHLNIHLHNIETSYLQQLNAPSALLYQC